MRTLLGIICLALLVPLSACTKKPQSVSQNISGKIDIAPLLERAPIQPSAALYLIVRSAGQDAGPPVAVKQFTPPFHFPIDFTVSAQDAMIPDTPFQGPFVITARLSQSGSATPALKGDFEGGATADSVAVGARDVEVRLARIKQ